MSDVSLVEQAKRIRAEAERVTALASRRQEEIAELRMELQRVNRKVEFLLARNGGLSETEQIAVEA